MRSMIETTRWCPVCESPGVPIVWGEPTAHSMQLAEEGRVIIAGCTPLGIHPSHACAACDTEFIAADRVYKRETPRSVLGIGVWPHGRRPVRIEENDEGWTAVVGGEGSMLIRREGIPVFIREVFEGMWPWEVERWITRRGFDAVVVQGEYAGWEIRVADVAQLFELTLVKHWWRSLGRNPVKAALDRLTSEDSSPIWLPG